MSREEGAAIDSHSSVPSGGGLIIWVITEFLLYCGGSNCQIPRLESEGVPAVHWCVLRTSGVARVTLSMLRVRLRSAVAVPSRGDALSKLPR